MARFGRGQPHAPIFLRNTLVAAVAAAATVSPIHVVSSASARVGPPAERRASAIYLRTPLAQVVVAGTSAPQINVISLTGLRASSVPKTHTIGLRSPLPIPPAPQIHVVGAKRTPRGPSRVIIGRTAPAAVTPAVAIPQQPHIIGLGRAPRTGRGHVTFIRNAAVPVAVPDRLTPQIHVVSLPQRTPAAGRRAQVTELRNPAAPAVTPFVAPVIRVVSAVARTKVPRKASVVILRAPATPPGAPQVHVVLAPRRAAPVVHTTFIRTTVAPVIPPAPVQIHVIGAKQNRRPVAHTTFLRTPAAPIVPVQIHVVGAKQRRTPTTHVTTLRNRLAAAVAAQRTPQIHIVLAPQRRAVPSAHIILRTAPEFIGKTLIRQILNIAKKRAFGLHVLQKSSYTLSRAHGQYVLHVLRKVSSTIQLTLKIKRTTQL